MRTFSASSVRCSPTRATSCTWSAAACATRCSAGSGTDLDFTTDARPEQVQRTSCGRGPTRCGTPASSSGPSARQGRPAARDHHVPRRHLRPGVAQPAGAVRRPARRRPGAPRLHGQRDGGAHHRRRPGRVPRPARRPGRRCATACWTRRRPRRCRSATIRCGCCGRRGSCPSSASPWRRGCATRWSEMAPQLDRITAERVAAELDKLLLGEDPVAGIDLMVQTGLGEQVLPEIGAMRMAIDEHHQHKDVYQHSLTVLRQAIDLEEPRRPGPGAAVGRAAARHRQAGDPPARARRRGQLPPPRGGRREDGPQADAGAEVLQADGRRRLPAGVPAPAVPRLRRRPVDRLGGAALRHRRGPAAARGCTSWSAPTAPPATSAGRRGCRPTTTTWRTRIAELAAQEDLAAGAARPRRQRDHAAARHPGGPAGRARRGGSSRSCGWTGAR